MDKIIEVNQLHHGTVNGYDSQGNGVVKIDGYTVFVPYAVAGDEIEIEITKTNKTYGFGKIKSLINPSKDRIEPVCPHFYECGACSLMHIDYNAQLAYKKQLVIDAFTRLGGFENPTVLDTIGSENPLHYRNKTQFPVGNAYRYKAKKKVAVCGFYKPKSHSIVSISKCLVSPEHTSVICSTILEFMNKYNIEAYNEEKQTGFVRHIFIRHGEKSGEIMVCLVTNGLHIAHEEVLVSLLLGLKLNIVSIIQNINTKNTNLILGNHNVTIFGKDGISDSLMGNEFIISPHSFYQINHGQTEKLYSAAIEFANIDGNSTVFDLYCGIGTISLAMAKKAKEVIGVEIVSQAVKNARENSVNNSVDNAFFYEGAVENVLPSLVKEGKEANIVVIDPPRKGAEAVVLETILSMEPKTIVYISCNPATASRDAKLLCESGQYRLIKVQPVDMFCFSSHVECVVLMSRV